MLKASVKVTLGAYDLVDFATHFSEFEPRLSQAPSVQIAESLRGGHVRTFGRGNIRNEYTFSRVQQHATRDAAITFLHDFAGLWPTLSGVATITTETDSLGQSLADAVVSRVDGRVDAMLTRHIITLVGGDFTANT